MQSMFREWLKAHTPESGRQRLRRIQAGINQVGIRIARLFSSPRWPHNPDGKVFLNLGCGDVTHPQFVNVDARAAWHVHYIRSIDNLSPIPDNFADLVYASHCLEHFSHYRVNTVLTEWRRVLKPGGLLRLGVPDFDQLLALYEACRRDIESIQVVLMGAQTYPLNSHFVTFTRKSLTDRLKTVGFIEVRPWERGTDELTSLPDCTGLTATVSQRSPAVSMGLDRIRPTSIPGEQTFLLSLNLEAVK